MGYELKELGGNLFTNQGKQKETQPDFTGNVKVNGVVYSIAGWKNTSKNTGNEYTSLKLEPKEDDNPF